MLIIMDKGTGQIEVDEVVNHIKKMGFRPHPIPGEHRLAIGITGNHGRLEESEFLKFPGVKECIHVTSPYKLASRDFKNGDTIIKVKDATFGGGSFVVMAGPCAVENEDQVMRIAKAIKERGAHVIRGGAYKPRTSPYSFQGLGVEGLKILKKASEETGLPVITEALDLDSLKNVYEYADIIQIGARNMQNFSLLQEAGKLNKPVMLKRGISATLQEWLSAAEYIMQNGNHEVILCERGIRSYDKHTRNLLDLAAVPAIKSMSHLPVVVDPSHGTGRKELIPSMTKAALAAGADSVIVEVHDRPKEALSDGPQALLPSDFEELMISLRKIAAATDKVFS